MARWMAVVMTVVLFSCGGSEPGGSGGGGGSVGGGAGGGGGGVTCGAANCAGCCLNGTCQPGNTASGCGKAGAVCAACGASQVCRTDQTCGVDPEAMWVVQPTSAGLTANNNGSAWDGDGSAPDARVLMWCADSTSAAATAEVTDSYQPRWTTGGCAAKAKDLLRAGWTFQVIDVDVVSDDTVTAQLKVTLTEQHFSEGGFSLQATGGLQSMAVSLTRQ